MNRRAAGSADGLIVGGGPAGAALAYWLATGGHRIVIVERKHYPRRGDLRRRADTAGGATAGREGAR